MRSVPEVGPGDAIGTRHETPAETPRRDVFHTIAALAADWLRGGCPSHTPAPSTPPSPRSPRKTT